MTGMKIVIPHATTPVIPACDHLRHPRMLLSGDLLKRLFKRSQTVWEIPAQGRDDNILLAGMTGMKIVIHACHTHRHPRMLLSGDLLKRLFKRSQTVWEIPARGP